MQLVVNPTAIFQSTQQEKKEIPKVALDTNSKERKVIKTAQNPEDLLTIEDYHKAAKSLLSNQVYAFYSSGSDDQITLADNVNAFKRIKFIPRVFVDVSNVNLKISLLEGRQHIDFPVIIAPFSLHGLAHAQGEKATARAAVSMGTILTVSTFATTIMEEIIEQDVVRQNNSPLWYQLYILKDRDFTARLVNRAEKCGYKALIVTADHPFMGNREVQLRDKVIMPENVTLANLLANEVPSLENKLNLLEHPTDYGALIDPSLTWDDMEWLQSITKLPIIIKGAMTPLDALKAYAKGCKGIVVSNHGARQLDHSLSTIEALPAITRVIREISANGGREMDVYVDGGFRRGSDILKALCLGAKAVMIGRPAIYGLATSGMSGVRQVLAILKKELELAMQVCGISDVNQCNESFVLPSRQRMQENQLMSNL